jgi:hypothetical protein
MIHHLNEPTNPDAPNWPSLCPPCVPNWVSRNTRAPLFVHPPPPALLAYWPCMLPACRHCYDSVCFSSLLLHHLVRRTTPFSPPLHLASIRAAPCLSLLHPHVHPCHPLLSPSRTHPTDEQQRIRSEVKRWYEWLNKPYEWLSEIF